MRINCLFLTLLLFVPIYPIKHKDQSTQTNFPIIITPTPPTDEDPYRDIRRAVIKSLSTITVALVAAIVHYYSKDIPPPPK